jgi:GDSL-like Lipase/Acylhydrolase
VALKMRNVWKKRTVFSAVVILVSFSIGQGFAAAAEGAEVPPDFSRFVVVGDSLSAGLQNLSLNEDFQPHGYAALIARQLGIDLHLPLISRPGMPPALTLVSPGPPPILGQEPGPPGGRLDPFTQTFNISVPNQKINEVLSNRPDCFPDPSIGGIRLIDVYAELILGLPACIVGGPFLSEIEMAEALHPTFAILWVGNNDTLWAGVLGVTSEITDPAIFQSDYEEIVQRMVATGSNLVIGNLPDVTTAAFLIPADKLATLLGTDLAVIGPPLGIGSGDYVTLFAFDAIRAILSGAIPGPLPDNLVVSATEAAAIKAANDQFNQVVSDVAARYRIPVVDIRGLLTTIHEKGIVVGGQRLTTDYLGGIFSLDGFHPTNTGYAITANEFIKAINKYYGTAIPLVNLLEVKATDPLVFPDTGKPPSRSPNK